MYTYMYENHIAENTGEFSYVFRLFGGEKFGEWPTNGKWILKIE